MARERVPADWARDLAAGRDAEEYVKSLLSTHQSLRRIADFSEQPETPDFEFQFEGERVGLEVKTKRQPYSQEYRDLWPELDERDLFILDETSLRALSWSEGMGYLLIADVPTERWVVMGPWELLLGPRRRFERLGRLHAETFPKGKLLLDLSVGESMSGVAMDQLLAVVRRTRATRRVVQPIKLRGASALPVVPKGAVASPPRSPAPAPGPAAVAPEPAISEFPSDEPITVEFSDTWCGLSTVLAAKLHQTFGWDGPTEVQRSSIPPVLSGDDTLVLAPTAGGKTEAALLPLLDVAQQEAWRPTSILAISPMKALLDDQLRRYQSLGALTGASAFAWHGDVSNQQRAEFLAHPTDILLTTPESLEILLHRSDARHVLNAVQAVIVDEVHSFVSTPRGAQLAALLERLNERCAVDVQRVGLSATVATPVDVLQWLHGGSHRHSSVASVAGAVTREESNILTYEDDLEITSKLDGVLAEQKSLVFVQSRRRAESLGHALGVPIHHSSISAEARATSINAFREGHLRGIIATATLELGIDIGDVELVVQDASPASPASYLQRVGRSGRRTGNRRMLFTCGSPDDLLQVLAVLARVRRGALDELPLRRGARLMLGQQAIAFALDPSRVGFDRHELASAICYSPVFKNLQSDAVATIEHLVAEEWLADVRGVLVAGHRTQTAFGGGGLRFAKLAASFETQASVRVISESGEFIGSLDWAEAQEGKAVARGEPFVLGGRAWQATEIRGDAVLVVPAEKGHAAKSLSWRGPSLDVGRLTWETAREILEATDVPAAMDQRGELWLEMLRTQWAPRLVSPVVSDGSGTTVVTFAGASVHRSVLSILGMEGTTDGPTLTIATSNSAELRSRAQQALTDGEAIFMAEADRLTAAIGGAHRELIPKAVLISEAREFEVDDEGIRKVLSLLAGS